MLYVRTEQRPGDKAPRHLFLSTRNRVVVERWLDEVPEALELKLDTEATGRAREAEWRIIELEAKVAGLSAALKEAVGYVPVEVASELRRIYRETHDANALGVIR